MYKHVNGMSLLRDIEDIEGYIYIHIQGNSGDTMFDKGYFIL